MVPDHGQVWHRQAGWSQNSRSWFPSHLLPPWEVCMRSDCSLTFIDANLTPLSPISISRPNPSSPIFDGLPSSYNSTSLLPLPCLPSKYSPSNSLKERLAFILSQWLSVGLQGVHPQRSPCSLSGPPATAHSHLSRCHTWPVFRIPSYLSTHPIIFVSWTTSYLCCLSNWLPGPAFLPLLHPLPMESFL